MLTCVPFILISEEGRPNLVARWTRVTRALGTRLGEARNGFKVHARAAYRKWKCRVKSHKPEIKRARNDPLYVESLIGDLFWFFAYKQHSVNPLLYKCLFCTDTQICKIYKTTCSCLPKDSLISSYEAEELGKHGMVAAKFSKVTYYTAKGSIYRINSLKARFSKNGSVICETTQI